MIQNDYLPFPSKILEVIPHTEIEYTFRMEYRGSVKPGQFFEVSIPRFGEAPISVSGIREDSIDLTIRKVGKVTNEIFENYVGDTLLLRGPYGNGFDINEYIGKDLIILTGGTGLAPVRGVTEYFSRHPEQRKSMMLFASFREAKDVLFRKDLEQWKNSMDVRLTLSREKAAGFESGRITAHLDSIPIGDNTAVIIVGPHGLMQETAKGLIARGLKDEQIWISEERRMCCGLGKCGHCKIGRIYVCLDGPVFNYAKIRQLLS